MCLVLDYTVETRIKEPRVFLDSLDSFLRNGLVFSIPACKIVNKALTQRWVQGACPQKVIFPIANSGIKKLFT